MEIFSDSLIFLMGLAVLLFAADWLIHGCVKLSFIFKLTPFFIGLVVVAFGTSVPEAGVGITAALRGQAPMALGTILGSNIANIGLILGLCALISPTDVMNRKLFKKETFIMILSAVLLYVLALDLVISRVDGLILIALFIVFCVISYKSAHKEYDDKEIRNFRLKTLLKNSNFTPLAVSIILASIAGTVIGADLMVRGGSGIARHMGMRPWLIGITVFAVGTSLPELAASLAASAKKIHSISIGNIIGSNIFNILLVLGVISLIRPVTIHPSALRFEFPSVLVFSLILLTVIRTHYKVTRLEGLIMVLGYIGFIVLLVTR